MKSNVSLKNIKNLSALFIKDRSSHIDLFKNKKINPFRKLIKSLCGFGLY